MEWKPIKDLPKESGMYIYKTKANDVGKCYYSVDPSPINEHWDSQNITHWLDETTPAQSGDGACPCLYLDEPCHDTCTCKNGFSSSGCMYCCTYGSIEQRKNNAKRIAEKLKVPPAQSGDFVKDLKRIKNYFGEHDITGFEHWAYIFLDKMINCALAQLGEKNKRIEELEAINYGVYEGCEQWESKCVDLQEKLQGMTYYANEKRDKLLLIIEQSTKQGIELTEANKRIKWLEELLYTVFTYMSNDPFQTQQESWEQFKAENSI